MDKEKLDKILEQHEKFLRDGSGKRADLRNENLIGADLVGVDLVGVDLRVADLVGADLRGADLRGADLRGADLRDTNLEGVNLSDVDLRGTNNVGVQRLSVIECQLNTSDENRRVSYWVELDVVTVGCYQGSWSEFKERVSEVYKNNEKLKRKYNRVITFIEAEVVEEEVKK